MSDEFSRLWEVPEVKRIQATLLKHSADDYTVGLAQILPLTSSWIFDSNNQSAIEKSTSVDLDQIVQSLDQARIALERLHPNVTRVLEYGFSSANAEDRRVAFITNGGDPYKCYNQIELLLDYLCEGLKADTPALENAKRVAVEMPTISSIAKKNSTWAKAKLVETARTQWPNMTGEPAPFKPSVGTKFFDFVGDLILDLKQEWDTESTINAFNNSRKK